MEEEIKMDEILERLTEMMESRKLKNGGNPDSSYISRLFSKGEDSVLKKIGEEAAEVIIAAKGGDRQQLVYEMADLWFHSLIALAQYDLSVQDVLLELARREGLSGLEEFSSRK